MEPRISIITLGVRDLDRSLKFYRDGLGLPTTWSADQGVIFLKTAGTRLALFPLDKLAEDVRPDLAPEVSKFRGISLAHNTRTQAEVDEILVRAEKAGGRIEKAGQKAFWGGYSGYFTDPDGHLWEVAFGAFDFLDDGSLDIP
jgi:catechol 2,3-dioxygenase-like lactoylglutathione lyase family enzyme